MTKSRWATFSALSETVRPQQKIFFTGPYFLLLTTMFLGRLMRSAMVLISLKALSMARSELLMVLLFWYFEFPNSSKLAAPVPCGGKRCTFTSEIISCETTVTSNKLQLKIKFTQYFCTQIEPVHLTSSFSH